MKLHRIGWSLVNKRWKLSIWRILMTPFVFVHFNFNFDKWMFFMSILLFSYVLRLWWKLFNKVKILCWVTTCLDARLRLPFSAYSSPLSSSFSRLFDVWGWAYMKVFVQCSSDFCLVLPKVIHDQRHLLTMFYYCLALMRFICFMNLLPVYGLCFWRLVC